MREKNFLKKIWTSFHSMKFGIILLIIIGLSSIIGTVIPQNNPLNFYEKAYSPTVYELINKLSLYKVYTSWWFVTMVTILSINLILCSIIRLPVIIKRLNKKTNMEVEVRKENYPIMKEINEKIDIEDLFKRVGFSDIKEKSTDEGIYYFSSKNTLGHLGSWLCHIALIIIILFYGFGKIAGFESYIHGVSGTIHSIENTDYILKINDFNIDFREDHTVKQYISNITVEDKKAGLVQSGDVMVNHPFRMKKISIYQNGTGWAVDMEVNKNNQRIIKETIHQSEVYLSDDKEIALQFVNFYPDFHMSRGMPRTISPYLNNPKVLYNLYYRGHKVDMNVISTGEEIHWGEYIIKIDNPRQFTLLQIVNDPGKMGAGVGGAILLMGIILAFYFHPRKLKVFVSREGRTIIWGHALKNIDIFRDEIELVLEEIN